MMNIKRLVQSVNNENKDTINIKLRYPLPKIKNLWIRLHPH